MAEPLNPEYRAYQEALMLLRSPKVPPSLKSYLLGDILGIQKYREQGAWPFSKTAAGRARYGMPMLPALQNRDLLRAGADSTAAAFDSIINRGYR